MRVGAYVWVWGGTGGACVGAAAAGAFSRCVEYCEYVQGQLWEVGVSASLPHALANIRFQPLGKVLKTDRELQVHQ